MLVDSQRAISQILSLLNTKEQEFGWRKFRRKFRRQYMDLISKV